MQKDRLLNIALAVMACAALASTALVARGEFATKPAVPANPDVPRQVEGWRAYLEPGTRIGPADAAVTVIEFSDFQCVFCREHAEHLDSMRKAYPHDLVIVFRHFPVTHRHAHAFGAALAAECAGEQHKFEAYRNALFRDQKAIGRRRWLDFARDAAVPDTARFSQCVAERRYASRIEQDLEAGRKLGVPATPTSLVNGMKVLGAIDEERLAALIQDALRASRN